MALSQGKVMVPVRVFGFFIDYYGPKFELETRLGTS